ncbi:MAG: UvrD-helicase domain-containing protein [Alphaproteobacteria bacterium]|nr:UvrD-helicase domain-containing protein [Alphaproteobacteria bacterium]
MSSAQTIASNPALSAWVQANAGSGKTTVLVARIVRLLLDGAEPGKILCLTYTRAGAAEMQNRIFAKARNWAELDEDKLVEDLEKVIGEVPTAEIIAAARGIFAKLIDAPNGIKIHTIHAFCESVLKRFAIEAGVSPHFKIAPQAQMNEMAEAAYERLVIKIKKPDVDDVELVRAFSYITANMSEFEFDNIKLEIIKSRVKFAEMLATFGDFGAVREGIFGRVFEKFPFATMDFAERPEMFEAKVLAGLDIDAIKYYIAEAEKSDLKNMKKAAGILSQFLAGGADDFELIRSALLNKEGGGNKNVITAKAREKFPALALIAELVEECAAFKVASAIFMKSAAAAKIAVELAREFERLKSDANVMDFTDLILRTRALLVRPDMMGWILYKLDGGIDNLLIDESQDTSPEQWEIASLISENFFVSGRGAEKKSLFVVGDEKQSIFSFQGADIELLSQYKSLFKTRVRDGGFRFEEVPLLTSYRSAANILYFVDSVMGDERSQHIAGGDNKTPGYVEILPLAIDNKDEEFDGEDRLAIAASIAAERAADAIARGYAPGDIMVLVKKRKNARFVYDKFKERGIAVITDTREKLADNIIAEDFVSLVRALMFPYDDLSACEVLKSPFFDLSDADLFELCHEREGASVVERLRDDTRYAAVYERYEKFALACAEMMIGEFLALVFESSRESFDVRFGEEGREVIKKIFDAAKEYEMQKNSQSAIDFTNWLSTSGIELAQTKENSADAARVLTVHGAKGLEAPIVILLDTNFGADERETIAWRDGLPFVKNIFGSEERAKKLLDNEDGRLLYVALTRAKHELYILGAGHYGKKVEDAGWEACMRAMEKIDSRFDADLEILKTYGAQLLGDRAVAFGTQARNVREAKEAAIVPAAALDISKFNFGGASAVKNVAGKSPLDSSESAADKGTETHRLLEQNDPKLITELIAKNSELRFIFENPGRNEVEIFYNGEMRIDRLVFVDDTIWIIDYKSGREGTDYSETMRKYTEAVRSIYADQPDSRLSGNDRGVVVRAAIVWLESGRLEEIA